MTNPIRYEGPAPPPTPAKDDRWYDTVSKNLFVWNGRGWVDAVDQTIWGGAPPENPDLS